MSEREELIEAMVEAYNAEFNQTNIAFKRPMRAALSATEALGYRLVATEGPEFEALESSREMLFQIWKGGAFARQDAVLNQVAKIDKVLRAALETGERDG